jgi:hypothetical protein
MSRRAAATFREKKCGESFEALAQEPGRKIGIGSWNLSSSLTRRGEDPDEAQFTQPPRFIRQHLNRALPPNKGQSCPSTRIGLRHGKGDSAKGAIASALAIAPVQVSWILNLRRQLRFQGVDAHTARTLPSPAGGVVPVR